MCSVKNYLHLHIPKARAASSSIRNLRSISEWRKCRKISSIAHKYLCIRM